MKTTSRSLLACLALASLAFTGPRAGDRPSYQPKTGTTAKKQIKVDTEIKLEKMRFEMDGQDVSNTAGQVDMAMKTTLQIGVTDHYDAVSGGHPVKLKRSFDQLTSTTHITGSNAMMGEIDKDVPATSDLEGSTVVFTWNDGDSGYDVAFEGNKGGDAKLLDKLEENMDLRGFLPDKDVAEGDSWKIPAAAVKAALVCGGDTKLRPEQGDSPETGMTGMNQVSPSDMLGNIEGEFRATYGGTRTEDGVKVGVIHLKLDVKSQQDMSDKAAAMKEQMKLPDGVKMDISSFDGEYAYEAEGDLLWDLGTGLPHSLNLSGELRLIMDISMSMTMGSQDRSLEQSITFAGTQTISYTLGE